MYETVEYVTPNMEGRDALMKMVSANERRILGVDMGSGKDRTVVHDRYGNELNAMPADDSPSKNVQEKEPRVYKESKKGLHRKMRSLGMGKHVAGNARSLAGHKRIPGEVTVGQGKTVASWKAEQRTKKKNKNKMARKSRRKNRR